MQLIIAEKPDLGRAIAAAISAPQQYDKAAQIIRTKLHGEETVIVWCFGHLLELWDPEDYDEKYAKWTMDSLPFYFPNWKHKPRPDDKGKNGIEKRVNQIGDLLKQASTVVNAGDIDEEGQLLIDELLRYHNYTGRTLRLNTNDTSQAAMARALEVMEPNEKHVQAGLSAFGRQLGDKIFGYNLSRYFTLINGGHITLPSGRVKLPTLGLVVRRDRIIEGHQKVMYYVLDVPVDMSGQVILCRYVPNKENPHLDEGRILDKSYIQSIQKALSGRPLSPIKVSKSIKKEAPPLPFNQVKLFAYCAKRWDLQPDKVANITQRLRDKYNAITYNRSDCQYLSEDTFDEAPTTLPQVCANMGFSAADFDTSIKSRCFNNANLTAHTAIIPTCSKQDLSAFTEDERKVYDIIARYYLIQFMPPAQREVTKLVTAGPENGTVEAASSKLVVPGYLSLLRDLTVSEDDEENPDGDPSGEGVLSRFKEGQYSGTAKDCTIREQETKPPARYTQASLIEDMSSIAKYVENPRVKELLLLKDKDKKGENGSIGTPATRERIISDLISIGYIKEERKGKRSYLISTELGRTFYDAIPDNIRKVDVSAKWWLEQEQIKAGEMTPEQMARDVLRTVDAVIKSGAGVMPHAERFANGGLGGEPVGRCPKCGGDVVETKRGFSCTNKECKFIIWSDNKLFASIGKKVTASVVKSLLSTGKTTLKGCTSKKTGNKFDCILLANFSGQYPDFKMEFDNSKSNNGQRTTVSSRGGGGGHGPKGDSGRSGANGRSSSGSVGKPNSAQSGKPINKYGGLFD